MSFYFIAVVHCIILIFPTFLLHMQPVLSHFRLLLCADLLCVLLVLLEVLLLSGAHPGPGLHHLLPPVLAALLLLLTAAVEQAGEHQEDLQDAHEDDHDEEHEDQVTHQVERLAHFGAAWK